MKKIKKWLYDRFLPAYCREGLLEDNAHLTARVAQLKQESARLQAYIDGMQTALRMGRKITINNRGEQIERIVSHCGHE